MNTKIGMDDRHSEIACDKVDSYKSADIAKIG